MRCDDCLQDKPLLDFPKHSFDEIHWRRRYNRIKVKNDGRNRKI